MDKEGSKHHPDSEGFTNPHPPPSYEHPQVNYYAPPQNYGQANSYSGATMVHTMQAGGPRNMIGVVGTNMVPASVIVIGPAIGPKASAVTCHTCKQEILTRVEYNTSIRTHLLAALLCFLGCWPCVAIPYCVDSCKNSTHYCPHCNTYIGTYQAFS